MKLTRRFCLYAASCMGAMLLCTSLAARADDIQDANKLFKQGLYSEALAKVEAVLASKPSSTQDAQARFLKGLILTEQGKSDDAIKIFSALTDDYPDLPEPYNNLAVLYAGEGKYDKAKAELEMAIRTHPNYSTAHENLGDIYAKMASDEYQRAQQLDPNNANLQNKLSVIGKLLPRNMPSIPSVTPDSAPASAPVAAPETTH